MKTWNNGYKASEVKAIIDDNFTLLDGSLKRMDDTLRQMGSVYIEDFKVSSWTSGIITIPYSKYNRSHPIVELYIKDDNGYCMVYGGYRITDTGIELLSDINYEGRVVIR